LWQDIKWDLKHFNHVERLAIVGEKAWHKWMASFCKPFTTAEVRYFTLDELDAARAWINEVEAHQDRKPAPPVVPFMP
jgi:hypothetical protein